MAAGCMIEAWARHYRNRRSARLGRSVGRWCAAAWLVAAGGFSPLAARQAEPTNKGASPPTVDSAAVEPSEAFEQRIEQLIERLGSELYATRQAAERELQQIGLPAFDALERVLYHPDVQIAETARFLLNSITVTWSWPSDPPAVKQMLDDYSLLNHRQRLVRLRQLSTMPADQGFLPLVRIARYEASPQLAKHAALLLMEAAPAGTSQGTRRRVEAIRGLIEQPRRAATEWVWRLAERLEGLPLDGPWWVAQTEQELDLLPHRGAATSPQIIRRLYQWTAHQLALDGQVELAVQTGRRLIESQPLEGTEVVEQALWALDHALPQLVEPLTVRYSDDAAANARLMYALAEALQRLEPAGRAAAAEAAAFERLPLNEWETLAAADERTVVPRLVAPPDERGAVAQWLIGRGQLGWAIKELQRSIDERGSLESSRTIAHLHTLQFLLADSERYREAADALRPLVERLEQDDLFRRLFDENFRDQFDAEASQHFFGSYYERLAQAAMAEGAVAEAQRALETAVERDPYNPDLLIHMYELGGDEAWQAKTKAAIAETTEHYRGRIEEYQRRLDHQQQQPAWMFGNAERLANSQNQVAWLIANTLGDADWALEMSHRSLAARPDSAAYLDTLAHCYFRLQKYELAVAAQRQAIKLEPNQLSLRRALERFEAAAGARSEEIETRRE
jgi:tetratricopeptide (TPR) repeat protein